MKALIIVDVQVDFLPGGPLAVPAGDTIIPIVNVLQKDYDLVVATQDWHPADHGSFASQHPGSAAYDRIELHGLEQVLWPDHCIEGTAGAAFAEELDTRAVEAIFRKGTDKKIDSYSAFFDNGQLKATGLQGYLQARAVNEVHVCGLAADYCVYFTAMDSLQAGFKTAIVSRATKPIDKTTFMDKKEIFLQKGGRIL